MEIVKVQMPVASNADDPLPLVYAKGRRNAVMQPLDRATKLAMGGDLKAFFNAEFRPSLGRWAIGARVKDRDW